MELGIGSAAFIGGVCACLEEQSSNSSSLVLPAQKMLVLHWETNIRSECQS